jgi:hypothetical protein
LSHCCHTPCLLDPPLLLPSMALLSSAAPLAQSFAFIQQRERPRKGPLTPGHQVTRPACPPRDAPPAR